MVRKRLKKIITKHRESRVNKIEFQGDDKCVICQDKVQYPQGRIACLHVFCFSCINDWVFYCFYNMFTQREKLQIYVLFAKKNFHKLFNMMSKAIKSMKQM